MDLNRIKEIQKQTAYPDSHSVQQALLKVWNEAQQEIKDCKSCVHEKESADIDLAVYWCSKCIHNNQAEDNFEYIIKKK
jgi:hypothetical protein